MVDAHSPRYPGIDGAVVIVTGAGSGIGAETAIRFADHGALVVIADIDGPAANQTAVLARNSIAIETDVTDSASIAAMVQLTVSQFGRIDVLINNAMSCTEVSFLDATPDQLRKDIDVTLVGPILCAQAVLPRFIAQRAGCILNVGSVNGSAYFGNEAYSAAKAGLISLTKSIATRFGPDGVRSNLIAPGTVATPYWENRLEKDPHVLDDAAHWYPLGRVGRQSDIANALLFLASDAASWISGVTLPIDGGLLAGNLDMSRQIQAADDRA